MTRLQFDPRSSRADSAAVRVRRRVGERRPEFRPQPGGLVDPGPGRECDRERLVRVGRQRVGGARGGRPVRGQYLQQGAGQGAVGDPAQRQPEDSGQRKRRAEGVDPGQAEHAGELGIGVMGDSAGDDVGPVEVGGVHPGEFLRVLDVEIEGAENAQILVDGRGELDRADPGELEGAGQVARQGVGQGPRAGEVEGRDQVGGGGAGRRDRGGPGQVEGVGVGEHDRVGVRVHEVDRPALGPGPGGQVAGEGAAQRADVVEIADDAEGDVEDGRGQDLREHRGVPGVGGDRLADRGARQLVRVGLARAYPQSELRLGPRARHRGRQQAGQRAGDALLLEFLAGAGAAPRARWRSR